MIFIVNDKIFNFFNFSDYVTFSQLKKFVNILFAFYNKNNKKGVKLKYKMNISEKLFENLINAELLKLTGCDIYIPSQVKEAKTGIDALFQNGKRKVLFLQYKISKQYILTPKYLNKNSYRFPLHKSSKRGYNQHNKLVDKSKKYKSVGYLVPLFSSYDELYYYYHSGNLLTNVRLIVPQTKIYDNKYHYINYDDHKAFQHSNSKEQCDIFKISEIIEYAPTMSLEELYNFVIDEEKYYNINKEETTMGKIKNEFEKELIKLNIVLILK